MECTNGFERVLGEEEEKNLLELFHCVGKKGPQKKGLALLRDQKMCTHPCEFLYDWGYDMYCNCPDAIERFLKEQLRTEKD